MSVDFKVTLNKLFNQSHLNPFNFSQSLLVINRFYKDIHEERMNV